MNKLIVQTENLYFSYSKSKQDIQHLNLQIPEGSVYGFLGPNGSGKTTTIRLLLGLLKKDKGEITLFGKPFQKNRIDCLSKVGALIENPSLYEHLTATENLKISANYRKEISKDRIDEVLEIVKLSYVKKKKVKAFSLGMKQRLGLAIALLSNPKLLILDEPTNGLDPKGIIEMRELIKELNENHGITIFISSHLLSEIEKTCTHVGIINSGKIIFQDTVKALKTSKEGKISLEIDTENLEESQKLLFDKIGLKTSIEDSLLLTEVEVKEDISLIIDVLRSSEINVYQIKIKDNLEDLFLSLTETN
jgi:ABC-2 type transport system ATP-binding protein